MADQERGNKRRKKGNVVRRRKGDQHILIDKDDFEAINAMNFLKEYEVDGVERRVSRLEIEGIKLDNETMDKILSLSALKELVFRDCLLDPLPPSIGLLRNLELFELHDCCIDQIPTEIGDLVNLKVLVMLETLMQSEQLPASIGNLKKLEYLSLEEGISELPEEIWGLDKFATQLKDLEFLCVTIQGDLPEEIGTLTKLKQIDFFKDSGTVQLPASMVNLKELYHFELFSVESFDYRQLEFIKSLPGIARVSVRSLTDESYLHYQSPEILPDLIQDTPSLIDVHPQMLHQRPDVSYALSCNRFKIRNPLGFSSPLIKKLLPRMLSNASCAFYYDDGDEPLWDIGEHDDGDEPLYDIGKHDAVYKLLVDARESFLQTLLDRSSKNIGDDADESSD